MAVLAIAVLSIGCPAPSPQSPSLPLIEDADPEPRPGQYEYTDRVLACLGSDAESWIYWLDTPCPGTQTPAVIVDGACYFGLTRSCSEIYVATREILEATALAHEIGHCARLWYGLDGDAGHEDVEYWETVEGCR